MRSILLALQAATATVLYFFAWITFVAAPLGAIYSYVKMSEDPESSTVILVAIHIAVVVVSVLCGALLRWLASGVVSLSVFRLIVVAVFAALMSWFYFSISGDQIPLAALYQLRATGVLFVVAFLFAMLILLFRRRIK
jgi:hypothetical protein